MPKIVITEHDLTKPGVTPYTNFAVALPGYVANDKVEAFLAAADENGVAEISKLSDPLNHNGFEDIVGKVAINEAPAELAISPTCLVGPAVFADIPDGMTAENQFKYYQRFDHPELKKEAATDTTKPAYFEYSKIYLYPGEIDTLTIISNDDELEISIDDLSQEASEVIEFDKETGALSGKLPGSATIHGSYTAIVGGESTSYSIECEVIVEAQPVSATLYRCTQNTNNTVGYLKSVLYIFTAVEASDVFDATGIYARIASGKEGVDAINSAHYGNQIAYELIKMGYTVLYKGLSLDEKLSTINTNSWWECLTDKSVYDFRYIINGLLSEISSGSQFKTGCDNIISGIAKTRGDCTALIDVNENVYLGKSQSEALNDIIADVNGHTDANTYTAIFAPCVTFDMKPDEEYGSNVTFPGYFYYLACAAYASETFNEWYAIAGYTRGVCDYAIKAVGCRFGEAAINALEPRVSGTSLNKAINLITKIKANYYLWGNRTAKTLEDELKASHFLNVRQLCTTIKKEVYVACRRFTFDPNSDLLWINFCNAIRPTLERMKGDQGITDYRFVKIRTSRKGILSAKIRIVPIEAVEDFEIKLTLEDSLGGAVVEFEDKNEE